MIGQGWIVLLVALQHRFPCSSQFRAASSKTIGKVLAHAVRNKKLGILRPSIIAFSEAHLFFAERLAVGLFGVLLVRRAERNVAVDNNQRGTVRSEERRVGEECG